MSLIPTVTPLLVLPQTEQYYKDQGEYVLRTDALELARANGYASFPRHHRSWLYPATLTIPAQFHRIPESELSVIAIACVRIRKPLVKGQDYFFSTDGFEKPKGTTDQPAICIRWIIAVQHRPGALAAGKAKKISSSARSAGNWISGLVTRLSVSGG